MIASGMSSRAVAPIAAAALGAARIDEGVADCCTITVSGLSHLSAASASVVVDASWIVR